MLQEHLRKRIKEQAIYITYTQRLVAKGLK
jgi:hypothetical protein